MALPPDVAARIMAGADRGFRVPVSKYTYATGPAAGEIFLYSPKVTDPDPERLVLRQINSEAENKVWVAEDPTQFERCDDEESEDIFDDAHGVLLRDGWAQKLNEEDSAGSAMFKRGNRIWVERSLSPGQNMTKIPVVDLDTLMSFEVEIADICFIAQMAKTDDEEDSLAVAVGPVVNYYAPHRKKMAQLFIVWPADDPERIEPTWESWIRGDKKTLPRKRFSEFRRLTLYEEQWQIFRLEWSKLNHRFVKQFRENKKRRRRRRRGGREKRARAHSRGALSASKTPSQAESSQGHTSDFTDVSSSSGELGLHWKPGGINKTNCCNLSPICPLKPGEADLVPSYIGGWQEIKHYHVQDADTDECPQGAGHRGGHCILRNDRTECVFSHDQIRHVCCKMRLNPLLPGVDADPGDTSALLWERPVSPDNFYDFTDRVQPRLDADPKRDTTPETSRGLQRVEELQQELKSLARKLSVPGRRWRSQHRPYKKRKYPEIAGRREMHVSSVSEIPSEDIAAASTSASQVADPVAPGQREGALQARAEPSMEARHLHQQLSDDVQPFQRPEEDQTAQLDQRDESEQGSLFVNAEESAPESYYGEYSEQESLSGYEEDWGQDSVEEEEKEVEEDSVPESTSGSEEEAEQESSLGQSGPNQDREQQPYSHQEQSQQSHSYGQLRQHHQHVEEAHLEPHQVADQGQLPHAIGLQSQHQQYQQHQQHPHAHFQTHPQFQQTHNQDQLQPPNLASLQSGLYQEQPMLQFDLCGGGVGGNIGPIAPAHQQLMIMHDEQRTNSAPLAPTGLVNSDSSYGVMPTDGTPWHYGTPAAPHGPIGVQVSPITFWNNMSVPILLPDSAPVPLGGAIAVMDASGPYVDLDLSGAGSAGLAGGDAPLFMPGGLPWVPDLPDDNPT